MATGYIPRLPPLGSTFPYTTTGASSIRPLRGLTLCALRGWNRNNRLSGFREWRTFRAPPLATTPKSRGIVIRSGHQAPRSCQRRSPYCLAIPSYTPRLSDPNSKPRKYPSWSSSHMYIRQPPAFSDCTALATSFLAICSQMSLDPSVRFPSSPTFS